LSIDEFNQAVTVSSCIATDTRVFGQLRAFSLGDIEDISRTKTNQHRNILAGEIFLGFLLSLALVANDRSENANAFLTLLHSAAKLVPCVESSDVRCVWLLACDFEDVAERIVVKAAHGGEVGCQRSAMPLLKLLDEVLHVGGDYFFRRLSLLLPLLSSF